MEQLLLLVFIAMALGGAGWWLYDYHRQRPLSYWSKDQLDAAFARHPEERARCFNRGTLSCADWSKAMRRRIAEIDAELTRREAK